MMDTPVGSIHEGESSAYSSDSTGANIANNTPSNQLSGQADGSPFAAALSTAAALAAATATIIPSSQTHRQQEHHQSPTPGATVAPIISSDQSAPAPSTLPQMVPSAISLAYQGKSLPSQPIFMQFPAPLHIINGQHGSLGFPTIPGVKVNIQTPPIFLNQKLRSGKWTAEEEAFADLLIELFEKGHIHENNGCTLRSFLARKLHCAPMRISKKYAGKGIGKMVFLSKTNIVGFEGIGSPSYDANIARLRDAEAQFYQAIFPDAIRPFLLTARNAGQGLHHTVPMFDAPLTSVPLQESMPAGGEPPPPTNTWPTQPRTTFPQFIQQNGATHVQVQTGPQFFSQQPAPHNISKQQFHPKNVSQPPALLHTSAAMTKPLDPKIIPQQTAPQTMPQQEIPHHQVSYTSRPEKSQTKTSSQAPGYSHPDEYVSEHARKLHQAYLRIVGRMEEDNKETGQEVQSQQERVVSSTPDSAQSNSHVTCRDTAGMSQTGNTMGEASAGPGTSGIPNLLSGFDKVAAGSSPPCHNPSSNLQKAYEYSPAFTSQSFDDFHRLLGKDLSPLVLSHKKYTVPSGQDMPMVPPLPPSIQSASLLRNDGAGAPSSSQSITQLQHPPSQLSCTSTQVSNQQTTSNLPSVIESKSLRPRPFLVSSSGADSCNMFAQQSVFAASLHSAYQPHSWPMNADQNSRDWQLPTLDDPNQAPICLHPSFNNVVSEPSNASDMGTEDYETAIGSSGGGSGNESAGSNTMSNNNSNDSDGSTSDTSRSRKKMRISYNKPQAKVGSLHHSHADSTKQHSTN